MAIAPVRFATPHRRSKLISLTPLIDVVFMLLLFFMLATSFQQWRSMDLSPARASNNASTSQARHLLVRVHANRLDLAGTPVTIDELARKIAQEPSASAPKLLVRPAGDVRLQRLVTVIDELRAAGVSDPIISIDE